MLQRFVKKKTRSPKTEFEKVDESQIVFAAYMKRMFRRDVLAQLRSLACVCVCVLQLEITEQ